MLAAANWRSVRQDAIPYKNSTQKQEQLHINKGCLLKTKSWK
jgi:hypothetical protein